MNKQETKTVYEYERLSVGNPSWLTDADFKELRSFILQQEEGAGESLSVKGLETGEATVCMKLSVDKHGKEMLTVQKHVGTILLSTGKAIEILPKIFRDNGQENSPQEARSLVVEMLKACGIITYKSFQNANLHYEKMSMLEIYIRIFLNEIFGLYKKGLKSGYELKQENEKFLKGKLLFSQHIKYNFAHAERFFVEYDEFSVNRPENRLIKTTLERLKWVVKAEENKRDLRRLLMIFDDVERSTQIEADFQKCTGGRNMQEYENVLSFCKLFLRGLGYSTYAGKHDTLALLFPMEKLFEGYIAKQLKAKMDGWKVVPQCKGQYLFTEPKMFLLEPDVYLEKDGTVILLDTKWKVLLNDRGKNYGISQADMYQMFAYYKRYHAKRVVLVYPKPSENVPNLDWKIDQNAKAISARFVEYNGQGFKVDDLANMLKKVVEEE